jgi:SPP1 family predicted phage head-tail adaptor
LTPRPSISGWRERITLLMLSETADGQGGQDVAWTTLDAVPAEYLPIRVSERLAAQAIRTETMHRFRIRARSDVSQKGRAQWRPSWLSVSTPKTLEITGVIPDPDEPRGYLRVDVVEVS